jgi:hypothetical protein
MRNFLMTFVLTFFYLAVYGQEIKIKLANREINTSVIATSSDQIFTKDGNFKFSEIESVSFKSFENSRLGLYTSLINNTKIEFENGYILNADNLDTLIADYNKNLISGSDQYLIEASNNAMMGLILPILGLSVAYISEIPEIGIASGVVGFALQIVAWSKIKKAGKALRNEKLTVKN